SSRAAPFSRASTPGAPTMSRTRANLGASLLIAAFLCAGCKVGPDYQPPAPDVPSAFGETGTGAPGQYSDTLPAQPAWIEWWTKFQDPQLDSLIPRAVKANHELRIAATRVQAARAEEKMAESRLYPSLSVGGGVFATHGSESGFGVPYGIPGVSSNLF